MTAPVKQIGKIKIGADDGRRQGGCMRHRRLPRGAALVHVVRVLA